MSASDVLLHLTRRHYYDPMANLASHILVGLSLALLSGCRNESLPAADYIPDTGWNDDESAEFYEDWYGRQLRAMREPALSSRANLGGYTERFRLLVIPTFEPAHSYRIDWLKNGEADVRWVQLDGAGGYEPGSINCQGRRKLEVSEARALRTKIETLGLFSLPTADELQEKSGTFCFDGTALVFEHLGRSGRRFLTRHCELEKGVDRFSRQIEGFGPRSAVENFMCVVP